jgi:formyltetrahydrofolate-dependent phosphoribosylglycinamide formyltransferase
MSDARQPNPLIRLGVLLSGGGRTLLNLLEEIRAGRLHAEVAVVVASRECKGIERARAAGLRTALVPYRQIADPGEYSARITAALDAADVQLVVLAGFLSLWQIPPRYAGRVMNIHPALLPAHGGQGMFGRAVHEAVLAAGDSKSGCTVHFCTNDYDAGPVILRREVAVEPGDTPESLADRVFVEECVAYPEAIRLFAQGRLVTHGRNVEIRPPDNTEEADKPDEHDQGPVADEPG